jgi:2-methylisocitrate lyase-like PEP mutase family enzyme
MHHITLISNFQKFKELHQSTDLFLLPNAWNAKSAAAFQHQKFPAVATSSAAVANSLGYEDGEKMPFDDYLRTIKRILSNVDIPVTVDMETGYGRSDEEIYGNLHQLVELGVVGINIEDSIISKSGRQLKEAAEFAATIEYIKGKLISEGLDLFINLRCDTYILDVKNKRQETKDRLKIYEQSGADGIFLPCITSADDIADAISQTSLPLNVMCIPGLPDFEVLNRMGVKRISMGPFFFNKIYENIGLLVQAINRNKNFSPIL